MTILKQRNKTGEVYAISEQLAHVNEALTVTVAKLRHENNHLRRKAQLKPHVRIITQSVAAARLLALWHCTGYMTGRKAAYSFGMSERTWYYARALCMVARIHDGVKFKTENPEEIERALAVAEQKCTFDPSLLELRLPLSKRPKRVR
jgi:hypothetical protein